MKHFMVCALLAVGIAAAQDRPSTYASIMNDVAGAIQFDCHEHIDVPERSACYRLQNSPDVVRLQFDTLADVAGAEWRGAWQQKDTGATQRWFDWNGEPHVAWLHGEDLESILVLLPGSDILD